MDATENGQETARSIAPNAVITDCFDVVLHDDQIKGIALATPAETHASLAIKAMRAGKDVFVEKPMALSIDDAKAMHKVALTTDRVLMVGHLLSFTPAVLKLGELIDLGELGKINYVYSNRLNFGKIRTEENGIMDAPHDVAVILRLLGQSPIKVSASGGSYLTRMLLMTVSNLSFSGSH